MVSGKYSPSFPKQSASASNNRNCDFVCDSTPSKTLTTATPAGCGGGGTSTSFVSALVAKCCHRDVQLLELPELLALRTEFPESFARRVNDSRSAFLSVFALVDPSSQHNTTRSKSLTPAIASPRAARPLK